jgi:hypothetical protein
MRDVVECLEISFWAWKEFLEIKTAVWSLRNVKTIIERKV